MAEQDPRIFGRKIRMTFEDRDPSATQFETTVIENLNVEFTAVRTLRREANELDATIYNLSANTRQRLQVNPNTFVTLEVAYADFDFQKIFESKVRRVTHSRPGPDLETIVEGGDGEKAQRFFAKRRFGKNATLRQILFYLADTMEVGRGNIADATRSFRSGGLPTDFKTGISVYGYAESELGELLASLGIEYSIQDEQIQLMELGTAPGGVAQPVITLSAETGLVDTPSINNEGIMECRCLILPGIYPGSVVRVESEFVTGDFRVDNATYIGGLYGPDFHIEIEGQEPGSKVKK